MRKALPAASSLIVDYGKERLIYPFIIVRLLLSLALRLH
jgi:hypothetical protein